MMPASDPALGSTADKSKRLASLQPKVVGRWLTAKNLEKTGQPPVVGADTRVVDGTVISADISGFTRLAERLAEQGVRQAAEALITTINRCFEPMIKDVTSRGGDVLKFGGDAIFALFDGEDHGPRAALAAASMQRSLTEVDLGLDIMLSMTVGVASGEIQLILAGSERRELVVHGSVVDECLRLESDAEPGEVLVATTTRKVIPPSWVTEPEPGVVALVDLTRHDGAENDHTVDLAVAGMGTAGEDAARVVIEALDWPLLLGEDLADAVDAFDRTIGEIRVVTVGFVQLPTADIEDSEVAAVIERTIELCSRYGATMLSTDVSSGGIKILLAAGAPTSSEGNEDAMLATLVDLVIDPDSPPMKAGVNRGLVYAGFLGSAECRTFTVMGDPTNLAARLLGKADWRSIAVSQPVLDNARSAYATVELPPVMVKGRMEPVTVHQLTGTTSESRDRSVHPELVGREDVLAELASLWARARSGKGVAVELRADAGLGASRVLERFEADLPAGVLRFGVQGRLNTIGDPYQAVFEFLRAAAGIDGEAGRSEAGESLNTWLAEALPDAADLLPLIAPAFDAASPDLDPSQQQRVAEIETEFRQPKAHEAIVSLLAAALTVPTVVLVEDGQWLDSASANLLAALAQEADGHSWMILCSTRPDTPILGDESSSLPVIDLRPLTVTETEQLVAQVVDLPSAIRADVATRSGGNPLFAIELARRLGGAGHEPSAARTGQAGASQLPDTIEGLITSQIDRLGHDLREAVRTAAVLGPSFDVDLLGDILGRDPRGELAAVGQLIDVTDNLGEFRSEVVTQAARGGMSGRRRAEIHGRAAVALEDRHGDVSQLAWHHTNAGNHIPAWEYSRRAADRARELGVVRQAANDLAQAVRSAKAAPAGSIPDVELIDALVLCFDLSYRAKLYGQARFMAEEALERLDQHLPRVELLVKLAKMDSEVDGSYQEQVERLTAALDQCSSGSEHAQARAWLLAMLGTMHYRLDDMDAALAAVDTAIAEAESVRATAPIPTALRIRQVVLAGNADPARFEAGEKLIRVATEVGDRQALVTAHNNLALDLQEAGRWPESLEHFGWAIDLTERIGDDHMRLLPAINRAGIAIDQGEWDLARSDLDELRREAAHYGSGFVAAFVQFELGRLEVYSGRPQAARPLLTEALGWFEQANVRANVYGVRLALGAADIAEGRSVDGLEKLLDLTAPQDMASGVLGHRETLIGYGHMQQADPEQAVEVLLDAVALAEGRSRFGHALALVGLAEAEHFCGRARASRRYKSEADEILESLGVVRLPIIPLPR